PSARADGNDVDGRQRHRIALDAAVRRTTRAPLRHHGNIGAGAADVDRYEVCDSDFLADDLCPDDGSRSARRDHHRGATYRAIHGRQTASRQHDLQASRTPLRPEGLPKLAQIGLDNGTNRRIQCRDARPAVLPSHRHDLRRQRYRQLRVYLPNQLEGAALVIRVPEGEQVADGNRFHALLLDQIADVLHDTRLVERNDLVAV